jgi:hemerythrin-like domain-containing protein
MAVQIGAKLDSGFDDPIGMLKDCHRRIERFVSLLARVAAQANGRSLALDERQAVEAALRYFRESGPRHNSDEEQSLFPRLKDMPDMKADILRLAGEHQEADELHADIAGLFTAWLDGQTPSAEDARGLREMTHRLAELYREHIGLEEDHVFPQASRSLDPATLQAIGREFQQRRA